MRLYVPEKSNPLSDPFRIDESEAGNFAPRMRQAFHEAKDYRILYQRADDRNRTGDFFQFPDCWRAIGEN